MKYLQPDNSFDVIHPSQLEYHELFFGPVVHEPYVCESNNTADLSWLRISSVKRVVSKERMGQSSRSRL